MKVFVAILAMILATGCILVASADDAPHFARMGSGALAYAFGIIVGITISLRNR